MRSSHPCLLQLLEWPAGFDSLVLAHVANENDSILRPKPIKELAYLVRACQTRLVNKIEMLPFGRIAAGPAGKESLQSSSFYAGLRKLPGST
jgi:hypothetical protein